MPAKNDFYAIIMAGGRGTRFWPLSRTDRPKQLLKLFADTTLLEETIDRIAPLMPPENIVIVTGESLKRPVKAAVGRMLPARNIIAEPAGRNTSPAIALASAIIRRRNPRAVVSILPSDHLIADGRRFRRLLETAYRVARREKDGLVTFGIKPAYPETGYGYIERGVPYTGPGTRDSMYSVAAFHEKPDRQRAGEFLASGRYYWNSGMFIWSLASYEENLRRLDPALLELYRDVADASPRKLQPAIERMYRMAEATSVDYALLEKAPKVFVIEADMGWNDIGSWPSLQELLKQAGGDVSYNCKEIISHSSQRSLIFSPGKLVALLGVSDLIVVDTPDALLVAHRERSQEVKKIVEEVQRRRLVRYL